MKRNPFMVAAGFLAAAFLTGCSEAPQTPDLKHQVGIQLYSIRAEMDKDVSGTIQKVGEIGYNTVEAANYNEEAGTFYGMTPADFAELCTENHLKFISSHINCPDPNEHSLEEVLAWWTKAIADHKAAGCSYIVQPAMSGSAYDSLAGLQKYCELFSKVAEMCAAQGIKFGYHNHSGEFTTFFQTEADSVRLYDYMLTHTPADKMFFQLDLYWINQGGCSAIEYFRKYPGRFKCFHVKDELEVGASGEIDFTAIYKQSELAGMEYQIVEQEAFAPGLTPFESIKISLDNTRAAQAAAEAK